MKWLSKGRLYAFIIGAHIYFAPPSSRVTKAMIDHELEHCAQWDELGTAGFIWKYLTLLRRYGYVRHPMEQQARRVAGEWIGTV